MKVLITATISLNQEELQSLQEGSVTLVRDVSFEQKSNTSIQVISGDTVIRALVFDVSECGFRMQLMRLEQ